MPDPPAFLVKTVAKGSSAWNMGLLGGETIASINGQQIAVGGDIILSVDGIRFVTAADAPKIRAHLNTLTPGAPLKVTVLRAGRQVELTGKVP